MKLSVVIPVYNEINTIKEILKKVGKVAIKKEIIVVDDGSTDGTKEYLSSLSLRGAKRRGNLVKIHFHKKNQGKGAAIKTALKHATGDVLIIQDADLEYNPKDYLKLLQVSIQDKKAKVVYGSRLKNLPLRWWGKKKGSLRKKTPFPLHYLANAFLSWLTNALFGTKITDMETGYKMFTKEVYKKIKIESNRFDIEPEITAKIAKLGYKIYEVPIRTKPRNYQAGKKITAFDGLIAIWTLVKYKVLK